MEWTKVAVDKRERSLPRFRSVISALFVSTLLAATSAAQITQHLNFSAGAGFNVPTGRAGDDLNTGWDLDLRGGYNLTRHLALDLDFNYNHWNLNTAALTRYGEPGGYTTIWSLSFTPVYHFFPRRRVDAYAFGGPGLYRRSLSLTQPTTVSTVFCDPFFGCYPAAVGVNQVVASFTTYKGGFNFGGGLEYRLWDSRLKVFTEACYSRMFTTNGSDLTSLPVTFGLRW
jgi:opacity protein-like surface antigen